MKHLDITSAHIDRMKKALGMTKKPRSGKFNATQNIYCSEIPDDVFDELVLHGYARKVPSSDIYPGHWYQLTRPGVELLKRTLIGLVIITSSIIISD